MKKEKLEHLVTTRMVEGKCSREKQYEKMLDGLTKCLKVGQVTEPGKATRDRDAWKVMITMLKSTAPDSLIIR